MDELPPLTSFCPCPHSPSAPPLSANCHRPAKQTIRLQSKHNIHCLAYEYVVRRTISTKTKYVFILHTTYDDVSHISASSYDNQPPKWTTKFILSLSSVNTYTHTRVRATLPLSFARHRSLCLSYARARVLSTANLSSLWLARSRKAFCPNWKRRKRRICARHSLKWTKQQQQHGGSANLRYSPITQTRTHTERHCSLTLHDVLYFSTRTIWHKWWLLRTQRYTMPFCRICDLISQFTIFNWIFRFTPKERR